MSTTPLEKLQSTLAPELKMLRENMTTALASNNAPMNQITENYLKTHGKQIRPILVILSAKLFGGVNPRVIQAASAVELLHNASLIHDDVVDETKLRRDTPTLNRVWDNMIAVLVGDYFVSCALYQAILTGDIRITASLAQLGRLLSLGEIDQIFNAREHRLDEEAYLSVISQKTASLFVACVEMGAYAVGIDDEERIRPVAQFAELLGRCFQIRDDVFDYYDNEVGKPTGNDLREGKITLPLLHVLTDSSLPRHDEMLAMSRKADLSPDEIAMLITYARDNGGIDYAYSVMERLRSEADTVITRAYPDGGEAIDALREIFSYIINRDY